MKFITEIKLDCGHEITFGMCGDPGKSTQITHQKDPPIATAYKDFFENNIILPKRLLEIGVSRGGSLAIWREMFNDCEIIGIDNDLGQIQPQTLEHYKENKQIQIHHMVMPNKNITKFGMFDLIIDDGGHGVASVLPTFEDCWPMLNNGGTYIVEDWIQNNESKMLNYFTNKLVESFRCWPDATPMPNAPFSITIYRGFFAIKRKI